MRVKDERPNPPGETLPGWKLACLRLSIRALERSVMASSLEKAEILRAVYVCLGREDELILLPEVAKQSAQLWDVISSCFGTEGSDVNAALKPLLAGKLFNSESAGLRAMDLKSLDKKTRKIFRDAVKIVASIEQFIRGSIETLREMASKQAGEDRSR